MGETEKILLKAIEELERLCKGKTPLLVLDSLDGYKSPAESVVGALEASVGHLREEF